jgi:hypothetical protein
VPADDLSAPLGQKKKAKRFKLPVTVPTAIAGGLGLVLTIFTVWAVVISDPMGGEPSVVVAIAPLQAAKPETGVEAGAANRTADAGRPPAALSESQTVNIIDGSTGKRQEVQIGGGAVAQANRPAGGEYRLLESTRHGMIPKIASDGARPADIYSRPKAGLAKTDAPRIAIVVSGLGVGAKLTADAIAKMPPAVTLAFAPYGADAGANAVKAREAGHEIMLQVAMEPFDYPDNDPGPQTLLTSLTTEQNVDRLYWMMSRFQGYVGVTSYMGARFTSNESAFVPVLKEVAKRGLIYFDDGSSTRSLAAQISGATHLSFTKADMSLDAVPTPAEISKALLRLESAARTNGVAVGTVSALPVSIERVAQWAKTAESRGFLLVPISVAVTRSKSS